MNDNGLQKFIPFVSTLIFSLIARGAVTPIPPADQRATCDQKQCENIPGFRPLDLVMLSPECAAEFSAIKNRLPKAHLNIIWTDKNTRPSNETLFHFVFTETQMTSSPSSPLPVLSESLIAELIVKKIFSGTINTGNTGFQHTYSYICTVGDRE